MHTFRFPLRLTPQTECMTIQELTITRLSTSDAPPLPPTARRAALLRDNCNRRSRSVELCIGVVVRCGRRVRVFAQIPQHINKIFRTKIVHTFGTNFQEITFF